MPETIVGLGEALIDILPSAEVIGGAPLNFAIRAAELSRPLGGRAAFIGRVGNDIRGSNIRALLEQRDVDTRALQIDEQHATGYVDVDISDGNACYRFGANVAWDHLEATQQALACVSSARVLCFGTLGLRSSQSRRATMQLLDAAGQSTRILDINLREPLPTRETVLHCLNTADVLKCNNEEIDWLVNQFTSVNTGSSQIDAGKALLDQFDLHCLFLTRGPSGCAWLDREGLHVDSVSVDQVTQELALSRDAFADTVGAGDAAAAALAVGIASGWNRERIIRAANASGAFAASTRGATVPMPPEIVQRVLHGT